MRVNFLISCEEYSSLSGTEQEVSKGYCFYQLLPTLFFMEKWCIILSKVLHDSSNKTLLDLITFYYPTDFFVIENREWIYLMCPSGRSRFNLRQSGRQCWLTQCYKKAALKCWIWSLNQFLNILEKIFKSLLNRILVIKFPDSWPG